MQAAGRTRSDSGWNGLATDGGAAGLTDGRAATHVAPSRACADLAVFDRRDRRRQAARALALAFAFAASASAPGTTRLPPGSASPASRRCAIGDAPGLVVARTVAMLINEGADAVQQGVCTPDGADRR